MKRSEALEKIQDILRQGGGPLAILNMLEHELGMLPPSPEIKCSDPALQIWSGDNIDIPHWIIQGWDDE